MSAGVDLHIDAGELQKVKAALRENNSVQVKQGIFNPSFYIAIVEDADRIKAAWQEINDIENHNRYLAAGDKTKEFKGLKPLKDIFAETEKYNQFQLPAGEK